ncbi:MAG: bifunctional (p)ppGpp synthetase/guanosine-3',5'-bis(diphosphate) 3'-pyrophosphohydrolase, partial [Proteobacteria bacterium]|nr:bifunctional (p)ppGpp synthetase/guanosine-3',5'-bis(diphosphate) 3'-pyrophosphohydrolase [Pseudomonadota bacterium]
RLAMKSVEDVLAAIGRSEMPLADAVRAVAPDARPVQRFAPVRREADRGGNEDGWFNLSKVMGLKFRWPGKDKEEQEAAEKAATEATQETKSETAVPIRGIRNDVPVTFEPGGAVPGDRVVGVLIPNEGVRIFQIHSPRLKEHEHQRWIDVAWDNEAETNDRFPARIVVTALNEPGSLAQVAQVIGDEEGNIDNVRMIRRGSDFTDIAIEVEVWNLSHLNRILNGLRSKTVVSQADRSFD